MAKAKATLLGSSPTLEGIQEVIAAFYFGRRELRQEGDAWRVLRTDGTPLTRVRVIGPKRGRYRFEMLPAEGA